MLDIAKNIKELRTANNMTQQELAEKLNVTRQTISGWELGRTEPDLEMIGRLAVVFGVAPEEFAFEKKTTLTEDKAAQKKRAVVALVLVAVSVVWLFITYRYVTWVQDNVWELDGATGHLYVWYCIFKPLRYVFIAIAVVSLIRISINLHIKWMWLRIVCGVAGFGFFALMLIIVARLWFMGLSEGLWYAIGYPIFLKICTNEHEIIYVIPTLLICLAVLKDLKKSDKGKI